MDNIAAAAAVAGNGDFGPARCAAAGDNEPECHLRPPQPLEQSAADDSRWWMELVLVARLIVVAAAAAGELPLSIGLFRHLQAADGLLLLLPPPLPMLWPANSANGPAGGPRCFRGAGAAPSQLIGCGDAEAEMCDDENEDGDGLQVAVVDSSG